MTGVAARITGKSGEMKTLRSYYVLIGGATAEISTPASLLSRGKTLLAEFGGGGKLLPSMTPWLLDGTKPTRATWLLTEGYRHPFTGRACSREKSGW
jgi:hypothetical protein